MQAPTSTGESAIASPAASAAVSRLDVTDFRNHARARLRIDGRLIVLSGPNGAGKTNLLEALSMLAPGRGLRRAAFGDMARHGGSGGWALAARVDGLQGPVRIGMDWRPGGVGGGGGKGGNGNGAGGEGGARRLFIDGKAARASGQLGEHLRMGWLTPAMDRLFSGPESERRRFLDRLTAALDPGHAARAAAMEKLLRQRNRLLEDFSANAAWLDAVEAQLAECFTAMAAARMATMEALREGMEKLVRKRSGPFPFARLRLQGWVEDRLAESPAVTVEDEARATLARERPRDAAAGRTLTGAHRSALEVFHGPRDMPARLCSTGEQKALLIAIVLAHARAVKQAAGGMAPLLLLDEVAAHLDEARRGGLFEALEDLGAQVWMTGTDEALFGLLRGRAVFLRVEDGEVTQARE